MTKGKGPVDERLMNFIAGGVFVLWFISFGLGMFSTTYEPPAEIHLAFMLIIGSIFGYQIVRGGNGNGK